MAESKKAAHEPEVDVMTEVEKAEHNVEVSTAGHSKPVDRAARRKGRGAPAAEEEPKPFGWVNPQDQADIAVDQVAGIDNDDDGDMEFIPGNFAGVSADRLFKASTSHGYPAWSDEEIKAEEEHDAEIEATVKAAEARRAEAEKEEDKRAAKRLRDLVNGA